MPACPREAMSKPRVVPSSAAAAGPLPVSIRIVRPRWRITAGLKWIVISSASMPASTRARLTSSRAAWVTNPSGRGKRR